MQAVSEKAAGQFATSTFDSSMQDNAYFPARGQVSAGRVECEGIKERGFASLQRARRRRGSGGQGGEAHLPVPGAALPRPGAVLRRGQLHNLLGATPCSLGCWRCGHNHGQRAGWLAGLPKAREVLRAGCPTCWGAAEPAARREGAARLPNSRTTPRASQKPTREVHRVPQPQQTARSRHCREGRGWQCSLRTLHV